MERLFDPSKYEVEVPEPPEQHPSYEDMLKHCDELHDLGYEEESVRYFVRWQEEEQVRSYLGCMGF